MEGLETIYVDDGSAVTFIECNICNKSIRGETLYKIHLTTSQHIKRKDALVATGQAIRDHTVPDFRDIKQYLKYLKLDEPIIGLSQLEEEDSDTTDPQPGPRYICMLCDLHANLPNMVSHIVGRRHRQKFLEVKRKDLVTWDTKSILAQSGKVIRAKAEIVERQDGQGTPKPLRTNRNVGKSNISRVVQKQERLRNKGDKRQEGDQAPRGRDYPGEYLHRGGHPGDDLYRPLFHKDDAYMLGDTERGAYLREELLTPDFAEEEHRRADYLEEDLHRREFFNNDHRRMDQLDRQDYLKDLHRRDFLEEEVQRTSHPGGIPQHQAYPEDHYSKEVIRRRAYPENDPLKQFYSEEVLRGRARSVEALQERTFVEDESRGRAYSEEDPVQSYFEDDHGRGYIEDVTHRRAIPEDPYTESANRRGFVKEDARRRAYPEGQPGELAYSESDPHRRTRDRDPNGRGYSKKALWQGAGEREADRNRFTVPMDEGGQHSRDHLLDLVKTIRQEGRGQRLEASRAPPQRPAEGGRVRSEIPEFFRQFLSGATVGNKCPEKRKKKSRFSDATEQELDVVKRIHVDDCRRPRQETFAKPQGVYQGTSSRATSDVTPDTGNVLDVLNNIQIENVEEANFLKDKLCNLLKEFQANKSEKVAYKSQGPAVVSKDYNHMSKGHLESTRDQYERNFREVQEERHYESQPRRSPELYSLETTQDPYRERPREAEEQLEEHSHATHSEPRGSRRTHYEEVFGQVDRYPPSLAWQEEPLKYPERSQGSIYPDDYAPAVEEFYDPYQPTPPSRREWGYGMPPGPQISTSLDKITSTLLELVSRKS